MAKIDTKTKKEIKKLFESGKKVKEISEIFGFSKQSIYYWIDESYRKKAIQRKLDEWNKKNLNERRKVYKKRNKYMRNYQRKRYNEDVDFKEKNLERVRKWRNANKEKIIDYRERRKKKNESAI